MRGAGPARAIVIADKTGICYDLAAVGQGRPGVCR